MPVYPFSVTHVDVLLNAVLYAFFGLRLLYIAWRSDPKASQKKEIEEVMHYQFPLVVVVCNFLIDVKIQILAIFAFVLVGCCCISDDCHQWGSYSLPMNNLWRVHLQCTDKAFALVWSFLVSVFHAFNMVAE